ncbi:hypothetical protein B1R32_10648 [Abditibacterium utsteinense]|uniref:Glycoside hydrolase family 127 protein n=1 Tax=Abditibacterium utsteinense TaxID=1960156 RepID=A0A2S8STS4_9BACT|nr:beta-L-arabinofuranosidase domain-containing protein [Abditibacterium utsteinense]PQV64204.1 hypothetical protein B1R32_10648 [Abditibacterium utsteinense]
MTPQLSHSVVDTARSPSARLRPVALSAVHLDDTFWAPRRAINAVHTLKSQFEQLELSECLANFRRAAGLESGAFKGPVFADSDLYKWLEAASSTLLQSDDAALRDLVSIAARAIAGAQQSDGYLDTHFSLHPEKDRWGRLRDAHQLYCMGHFIQAAVAHFRATGEATLLDVATRIVACLDAEFGWAKDGKRQESDGHEEIELALIELFRVTGDERAFDLARFFVDVRGQGCVSGEAYHQDHVPFRELNRLTGHAVRALYYIAGAADLYLESGEPALWDALVAQWNNYTQRQMYISGGAGSRYEGEAFGHDFELPNARAYTETCASIAVVMASWRLLQASGEARFADDLERALYNGVLSGLSLSGDEYFYQNPLADDGAHRREKWFGCACCPPNIARLLAQLPAYFYSVTKNEVWVHLFAQNRAEITLPDGHQVVVEQRTNYPWHGTVTLRVSQAPEAEISLYVRVPGWASGATLDGKEVPAGTYAKVSRNWNADPEITLQLPTETRFAISHPYALENSGRVAVLRGPLLFCAEAVDNQGFDLRDLKLGSAQEFDAISCPDLLGGVLTLQTRGTARVVPLGWEDRLYQNAEEAAPTQNRPVEVKLVPYYAWANREAGQMQVWLRADEV